MKATLNPLLGEMSGGIGKDQYVSRRPGCPGEVIIKRKPGPKKKGYKMPEGQTRSTNAYKEALHEASRQYRDPELRARWQQEYDRWRSNREKNGVYGHREGEPVIRSLWDFVRGRVIKEKMEEMKER